HRYADGSIGFDVGPRDPRRTLVIDPDLLCSSYLAGSLADQITATTFSAKDSTLYVTGWTQSPDLFGATTGSQKGNSDAFLAQFTVSPSGAMSLKTMTLIGGAGSDRSTCISVQSGISFIGGATSSPDFPVSASAVQRKLSGPSS